MTEMDESIYDRLALVKGFRVEMERRNCTRSLVISIYIDIYFSFIEEGMRVEIVEKSI